MFFSWFIKRKNFKQKSNVSGQILPFLIVVIAIFLGAAMSTLQIGKYAISMSCRDNAADACALAAASESARAHNTLMLSNSVGLGDGPGLKTAYEDYRTQLTIDSGLKIQYLKNTKINIQAIVDTLKAIGTAPGSELGSEGVCKTWGSVNIAATSVATAQSLAYNEGTGYITAQEGLSKAVKALKKDPDNAALQAAVKAANDNLARSASLGGTGGTDFLANKMLGDSLSLKTSQGLAYLELRNVMDFLYLQAKQTGLTYALLNNCVFAGLSETQADQYLASVEQNFQAPIPGIPVNLSNPNAFQYCDVNNPHYEQYWNRATAQWDGGTAGVDVTVPKIASYNLEVTKMNIPCSYNGIPPGLPTFTPNDWPVPDTIPLPDPFGTQAAGNLLGIMDETRELLSQAYTKLIDIYNESVNSAGACAVSLPSPCDPDDPSAEAKFYYQGLKDRLTPITEVLSQLVTALETLVVVNDNGTDLSIAGLIAHEQKILEGLGHQGPTSSSRRIVNSSTDMDTSGLIIIGIDSVNYEPSDKRCIECKVQFGDGPVSSSTAAFNGGSMRTNSADIPASSIYTPRVIGNKGQEGCPAETPSPDGPGRIGGVDDGGCSGDSF